MGFLKYPVQSLPPMQFAPPQMPVAPDVNPIAAAQAAAQAEAQAAMKQGGIGNGSAPAGAAGTMPGMQTNPMYGKEAIAPGTMGKAGGGEGGMMGSINSLFGGQGGGGIDPNMLAQLMAFL